MNTAKWLLTFIGLALILAIWMYFAGRRADSVRKARFLDREDIDLREWQQRFYGDEAIDPDRMRKGVCALAELFDIPAGQLRPSDRFDLELAPPKGWEYDDTCGLVFTLLPKYAIAKLRQKEMKVRTVDDFIRIYCEVESA